jgi:hypothetical protein
MKTATKPRTAEAAGATPARPRSSEEESFNEAVHALLRDGAERREERTRTQALADTAAARQQLEAIVALSRGRRLAGRR